MSGLKINLGSGLDRRDGFVNVDGNELLKPDIVLRLPAQKVLDVFDRNSAEEILIQDFLEHFFRWEAEAILRDSYAVLKSGGKVAVRVPDFKRIIRSLRMAAERKITLLFGGQDIPQGEADPEPRRQHPEFYCHKYAYTQRSLAQLLQQVGFVGIKTWREGTNFWAVARKE